ncbi:Glycine/D-amino acid oxidase [Devosia enhydra]|uniref:Glycine/D-amino acid oxidase n=1 Tax=Devosia enhydra TaxID=665118 RepID=A0A1K2HZI3_9HYPH|nr:FAD-binding oxidoreductase [Devosia enhydra]SFZ85538.1 Glycine/D-amino acid oxidase [Devosia enhydra]
MKAIVVGAGVIGSSIAYRIAEAGAEVTLIDANRVGAGTSATSYAWVNACEKINPRAYYTLNMAGVRTHRRVAEEEFKGSNWLHRPGVIQWQSAGAEAEGFGDAEGDKVDVLRSWGYPAERIDAKQLAELEPDVDPATFEQEGAIYYPEDGWLDAPVYAGTMVRTAIARHGLKLLLGHKVTALLVRNGAACGVVLQNGETIEADVVVNSGGRWANEVVGAPDFELPLAPTVGLIAYTTSSDTSLRHGMRTPLVNCRPDGAGRLLLRANDIDKTVPADSDPVPANPAAQKLLERTIKLMPALKGVAVEAVRIAIRPIPADGLSAIGPHPALKNYYVTVTHSGVTMGAFIGEAVTAELVHGRQVPELAEFRPARFFGPAV